MRNPDIRSHGPRAPSASGPQPRSRRKAIQPGLSAETKSQTSDNVADASASVQLSNAEFDKVFNRAYNDFYHLNKISTDAATALAAQDVDIEQFDRLTLQKQLSRYISLIDGHIIFHEVPNAPHGQVIGCIHYMIISQIGRTLRW